MAYSADTIEHVDDHIGNVTLADRPGSVTLENRPSPVDRPFGGVAPRYRFSDDLDGKHRDHDIHFSSIMTTDPDGKYTITQENESHLELDGGSTQPPVVATGFNIDVRDTHANILARTGDATGVIAYGTDTQDLYVYDGASWQFYRNT